MSTITRHSDTCVLTQTASGKTVEAVVQDFRENEVVHVIVNRAIKIAMKWNGKCYEGRMASMDLTTDGPTISKTKTGSRG
jgi:hypothetical protein